jgi:phosphopantetheinyl transferase (holo-ACP synthase)
VASEEDDGVVASAVEVLEIAVVHALVAGGGGPFTAAERAYAASKSDPERRLAARLAAKRAAAHLLGDLPLEEIEVARGRGGPPRLTLSAAGRERLRARGAQRALVSLTHGREYAAACVLLLRDRP